MVVLQIDLVQDVDCSLYLLSDVLIRKISITILAWYKELPTTSIRRLKLVEVCGIKIRNH